MSEESESVEIARIDVRSIDKELEKVATEIIARLYKDHFRIVDLRTILFDGNQIVVKAYGDSSLKE